MILVEFSNATSVTGNALRDIYLRGDGIYTTALAINKNIATHCEFTSDGLFNQLNSGVIADYGAPITFSNSYMVVRKIYALRGYTTPAPELINIDDIVVTSSMPLDRAIVKVVNGILYLNVHGIFSSTGKPNYSLNYNITASPIGYISDGNLTRPLGGNIINGDFTTVVDGVTEFMSIITIPWDSSWTKKTT